MGMEQMAENAAKAEQRPYTSSAVTKARTQLIGIVAREARASWVVVLAIGLSMLLVFVLALGLHHKHMVNLTCTVPEPSHCIGQWIFGTT